VSSLITASCLPIHTNLKTITSLYMSKE